ncbi:hypothetical protein AAZX31_20G132800 [Glycine max]
MEHTLPRLHTPQNNNPGVGVTFFKKFMMCGKLLIERCSFLPAWCD